MTDENKENIMGQDRTAQHSTAQHRIEKDRIG